MLRLTPEQIQLKLDFMDDYVRAHNAADGSKLDANASVAMFFWVTLALASGFEPSAALCART